jgi:SAM-dependent methyltransferase
MSKPLVVYRLRTLWNLRRNRLREHRWLEIGPGPTRLEGFETLSIQFIPHVDYVCNAAKTLPFTNEVFELIYASHVLEHIPWYQTSAALSEWVRILKRGGRLEIWVPDGLKICRALIDYEMNGVNRSEEDGWYKFNEEKDPYKWIAGRIFSYGDGKGDPCSPNWHRALVTPVYLYQCLSKAGLTNVCRMERSEVRGRNHGWVNLGMTGTKP